VLPGAAGELAEGFSSKCINFGEHQESTRAAAGRSEIPTRKKTAVVALEDLDDSSKAPADEQRVLLVVIRSSPLAPGMPPPRLTDAVEAAPSQGGRGVLGSAGRGHDASLGNQLPAAVSSSMMCRKSSASKLLDRAVPTSRAHFCNRHDADPRTARRIDGSPCALIDVDSLAVESPITVSAPYFKRPGAALPPLHQS